MCFFQLGAEKFLAEETRLQTQAILYTHWVVSCNPVYQPQPPKIFEHSSRGKGFLFRLVGLVLLLLYTLMVEFFKNRILMYRETQTM